MTDAESRDRRELLKNALVALDQMQARLDAVESAKNEPIAIVGMSCRLPGGIDSPEAYWDFLEAGNDAITEVPKTRWDINDYVTPDSNVPKTLYGGFLDNVELFDPVFFGISPREAYTLDPQQRLVLEVGWEAFENAGIAPDQLVGSQTGVFIGVSSNDYGQVLLKMPDASVNLDVYGATGTALNAVAGRLSYTLGLNGPCMAVDTACSSSLVAIHQACVSLRSGESDMAIAGGVNFILVPEAFICLAQWGMISPDGRSKSFDARANGFVRAEGCGLVVLKRLSDAVADNDRIMAVIRGSAVNQDGKSSGLTVPNGAAQQALLRRALKVSGTDPNDISYIEAHGTGTSIGDPIEVEAITTVIGEKRPKDLPLILGSVKSNIGHLEAASGVAGLIKIILSLQHGAVPRNLHFQEPNPRIPWPDFPIVIPTDMQPWTPINGRRIAGISGFGFSGTNAHLIVEEPPVRPLTVAESERPLHVMTLSAKTGKGLRELAGRYASYFERYPDASVADAAFTSNTGHGTHFYRLGVVGATAEALGAQLAAYARGDDAANMVAGEANTRVRPKITFMFTGQGSQYVGMGRELYETEPAFRAALDQCDAFLRPYFEHSLLDVLYPAEGVESPLDDTTYTQPALFALEYALAQMWMAWGIKPAAVMGHSVGEYVAACVAGVFSLEDGLKLIAARARLMGQLPAGGQMAAIFADEARVKALVAPYADHVSIAAVNGPENVVISGAGDAVEAILSNLNGLKARKLNVSHAFHSPLMEPMLDEFERIASEISYHVPRIKVVSNVSGDMAGTEITKAAYWRKHVREAVQFAGAMQTLQRNGYNVFVEVGPAPTLTGMGQRFLSGDLIWIHSLRSGRGDWEQMLVNLAGLFVQGVEVDWTAFDRDYPRQKVALPSYPFQRDVYWMTKDNAPVRPVRLEAGASKPKLHPLLGHSVRTPLREILYENEVNLNELSFIRDHSLYGTVVFPGTGYLEIALAAAKATYGSDGFIISDLSIQEPMIFTTENRPVQVVLTPEGPAEASFRIFSLGDVEDEWHLHVQGRLSVEKVALPASNLAELQARFQEEMDANSYYEHFQTIGLEYGESFRGMKRLWRGDYEAFGLIATLDADQVQGYQIHPALLDSCLHLLDAALPGENKDKIFLPLGLKQLRVGHKPAGSQIWCHVEVVEKDVTTASDNFTAKLRLFDQGGQVIAEIDGLFLRRANRDMLRMAMQSRVHEWMYKTDWVAAPFDANTPVVEPGKWLIFADQGGIGEAVATRLQAQGASIELVFAAQDFASNGHHEHHVNPTRPEDFRTLLTKLTGFSDVLYLWPIDAEADDVEMGKALGTTGALHLAQALASLPTPPLLWLTTRGAKRVGVETTTPVAFSQRPLWGFARALGQEYPLMWGGLIDLDGNTTDTTLDLLVEALTRRDNEGQVALRGQERYAARLVHSVEKGAMQVPQGQPFALDITTRGILDNLVLKPVDRRDPGADQVEISVRATGLNFRDVLNALGMYPGDAGALGSECAGVVTRVGANVTNLVPGDQVIALASGTFRSFVVADADFCFKLPPNLTFAETMTIPSTFLTSYYGLHHLAGMKAGDKVLIHAAAGGVGLAAVQLALRAGAEVFGTAGSNEKRAYLKSLGVHHVLNSRTLDFADEIMTITNGTGVNIVLNSLNDEFITKSMGVLANNGVFLEIGKRGVWTTEQVAAFNPTLKYHLYDLVEVMLTNRPLIAEMMDDLLVDFEDGNLYPLPLKIFPINQVGDAFRYMAQAKHIGKIAVTQQPVEIVPDATYLITGGLGGLGLEVGRWLVQRGAQHVVLMGRRNPSPVAQRYIDDMQAAGAQVELAQVDVADTDRVAEMLQQIALTMPPLRGVIHAAGVLDDGVIAQQTVERFETVMASKVTGTMNLHQMTTNLDFFVMFSSASATLGSGGQSNYAAANAFMDGLAYARRSRGLPAVSINWGAWSQVGMASSMENRLADVGMGAITVDQGLQALDYILNQGGITQVTVVPMNWAKQLSQFKAGSEPAMLRELARIYRDKSAPQAEEAVDNDWLERLTNAENGSRLDTALSYMQGQIAKVLRLSNPNAVDPHISLSNMGLDSLMAMELRNRVETDLKVTIAVAELLEGPSPMQISESILGKLGSGSSESTPSTAPAATEEAQLLSSLDQLTDDEVNALLGQMLSDQGNGQ